MSSTRPEVDVKAEVNRLTGDGVDLAIEAAGAPQALAQTIQVTRPRGIGRAGRQPAARCQPADVSSSKT